jgi:hypothetical protein
MQYSAIKSAAFTLNFHLLQVMGRHRRAHPSCPFVLNLSNNVPLATSPQPPQMKVEIFYRGWGVGVRGDYSKDLKYRNQTQ